MAERPPPPYTPPAPANVFLYRDNDYESVDAVQYYHKTDKQRRTWRYIAIGVGVVIVATIAVVVGVVVSRQRSSYQTSGIKSESPYANLTRLVTDTTIQNKQRIFVVGDVHGCITEFNRLVDAIQYNPETDQLILAGDLVAKGPDSIGVIRRAKQLGAMCVRGNHDDKVVRLKTFELQRGAKAMLPPNAVMPEGDVMDPLKFNNYHTEISKAMTEDDYNYLASCPMILYLPLLNNSVVVHGGLLPGRELHNQVPYDVMNMRDLDSHGQPSASNNIGESWTSSWNAATNQSMRVYYGHDASRGLKLADYTYGLDSGCVYGRQLSALEVKTKNLTQVQSSAVTYRALVNPPDPSHTVGVAVGEQVYAMEPDPEISMLYTGQAPGQVPYRYVIMDTSKTILDFERFERPGIEQANMTFNEVFGRPWNKLSLFSLPQIYPFEPSDPGLSKLYDDGTIATLHFEGSEADIREMHTNKMEKKLSVSGKLSYIRQSIHSCCRNHDTVEQIGHVEIKIGGHSSRNWAKVPYKLKIDPVTSPQGLFRRWELKLRPGATDPTMLREKLYEDMLQSIGVLAPRGAYVRPNHRYLRETIHGGDPHVRMGEMIQGDAGKGDYAANLGYRGDDESSYDDKVYEVKLDEEDDDDNSSMAMKHLIQFMRFIATYKPETIPDSEEAVNIWQPKIDIVRYIRQLALEWIGGNWDGIQYSGNNFALYRHPDTEQYITIPMDFDYTFGNGLEEDQRHLMTATSWQEFTYGRKTHSYLWEKIKATTYLRRMYENTLKEINERLSNPDILNKRVESLAYLIQHDVSWDRSLERMTVGLTRPWTGDDFLKSIDKGMDDEDELIGLREWIKNKYQAILAGLSQE
ncbi:hypothetical protein EC973_001375 [Apophysomyces ossiformis]|uniref:Calcineurin-like phosphoesterase domain-containing protein n=1 Tax=Apophysomyces ossiformis TaxID=679940 RepID=A0A8H7C097_9FUNG|nr:hypothetical protein EC973_001375 [Apophysomyces ossiformis]